MAIYGIDLGTTNSILALGDKLLTPLVPSVVDISRQSAGREELFNSEATRSFKVNISTGKEGSESVVASSMVLKELKRLAGLSGRIQAVITVPAEFDDNQRKATLRAAQLADIEVVSLVNEPTAAAMYISQNKKTVTVVFDLGGGTFDVSVIDSRFGNYDVQLSAGNAHLGGDNFDTEIMKYLLSMGKIQLFRLPKNKKRELLWKSTEIKIRMQKERKSFDVDLSDFGGKSVKFTEEVYTSIMRRVFMKCITQLHHVMDVSLEAHTPFDICLVGGSTRCPYLREWITQEVGQAPIDLTYDPDLAVAYGAALYASIYEKGLITSLVSDITKGLSIGLSDGTVQNIIPSNSKIPIEEETLLSNPEETECLDISLYQGNSGLASMNYYIGNLIYDYGRTVAPWQGAVIVKVSIGVSGMVTLSCQELGKPPVKVELVLS